VKSTPAASSRGLTSLSKTLGPHFFPPNGFTSTSSFWGRPKCPRLKHEKKNFNIITFSSKKEKKKNASLHEIIYILR
jgi:hypothetical protein